MSHEDIIVEVAVEVEGEKTISIKAVLLTQRSSRLWRDRLRTQRKSTSGWEELSSIKNNHTKNSWLLEDSRLRDFHPFQVADKKVNESNNKTSQPAENSSKTAIHFQVENIQHRSWNCTDNGENR